MRALVPGLGLLLATAPAGAQRPGQPPVAPVSRQAILVAEDGRDPSAAVLTPLFAALESRDPALVALAVRALGRFESPAFLPRLLPLLGDSRPDVRIATAHALGQIGQDSAALGAIAPVLIDRLGEETEPEVAAAVARSVARLRYRTVDRAVAARQALLAVAARPLRGDPAVEVARALESLVRISGRLVGPDLDLERRVRLLAVSFGPDSGAAEKIRSAAAAALIRLARPDDPLLVRMAADPAVEVRRLAVVWAADSVGVETRREYLQGALRDASPAVRIEAVRAWARRFQGSDCQPLVRAIRDPVPAVSLEAIDRLGPRCSMAASIAESLYWLADSLVAGQRFEFTGIAAWHRGAHALVALSRLAPQRARVLLSRAAGSSIGQVRMYAARAAAIAGDPDRLLVLAEDRNDNVREAAVRGLVAVRGHGADGAYRAALDRPDYQLTIAAAEALAGTPEPAAAAVALGRALTRITAERKETSRDPRLAILDRLAEVARAEDTVVLEPLINDFDPVVATRAATLLSTLSGRTRGAEPRPLRPVPLDQQAIDRLRGARLRVTMAPTAGGGRFDIALFPEIAPATVARVVSRARAGYYDGLTFHRVEPNFVIQGGSPGANEYAGDARYLRDEIGSIAHERGTVGISTRGRDTGDAQLFVNLVDNLRLDFNYTVWGRVVAGLDVIDAILEGDVIDRIDLVDGGPPGPQP